MENLTINEEFSINRVDSSNWALQQVYQSKLKNGSIVEKKRDIGYSATIPGALRIAKDKLPSFVDKKSDIYKILKQIAKTAQEINKLDEIRDTSRNSKKA